MRAQRRDRNEPDIRRRAEALGFLWLENNASTKGRPDACLLRRGATYWCEVKQPGESFTPEQVDTFSAMLAKGVPVYVLETVEDVDDLAGDALPQWTGEGITIRDAKKTHKGKRHHRPGVDKARSVAEMCVTDGCVTSRAAGSCRCRKHGG